MPTLTFFCLILSIAYNIKTLFYRTLKNKYILLSLLAIVLSSCSITKINSEKLENYTSTIESLHLVTAFSDFFEKTAEPFQEETQLIFRINQTKLSLNEDNEEIMKLLSDSTKVKNIFDIITKSAFSNDNSHALLLVNTKSTFSHVSYSSGASNKNHVHSLSAFLIDIDNNSIVWTSEITSKSGSYGSAYKTGVSMSRSILSKLKEDGLFSGNFKI